jgi:hypothetical protein
MQNMGFEKNKAHSKVFAVQKYWKCNPRTGPPTNRCTATAMTTPRLCHTPSQAETWRESLGLEGQVNEFRWDPEHAGDLQVVCFFGARKRVQLRWMHNHRRAKKSSRIAEADQHIYTCYRQAASSVDVMDRLADAPTLGTSWLQILLWLSISRAITSQQQRPRLLHSIAPIPIPLAFGLRLAPYPNTKCSSCRPAFAQLPQLRFNTTGSIHHLAPDTLEPVS